MIKKLLGVIMYSQLLTTGVAMAQGPAGGDVVAGGRLAIGVESLATRFMESASPAWQDMNDQQFAEISRGHQVITINQSVSTTDPVVTQFVRDNPQYGIGLEAADDTNHDGKVGGSKSFVIDDGHVVGLYDKRENRNGGVSRYTPITDNTLDGTIPQLQQLARSYNGQTVLNDPMLTLQVQNGGPTPPAPPPPAPGS